MCRQQCAVHVGSSAQVPNWGGRLPICDVVSQVTPVSRVTIRGLHNLRENFTSFGFASHADKQVAVEAACQRRRSSCPPVWADGVRAVGPTRDQHYVVGSLPAVAL